MMQPEHSLSLDAVICRRCHAISPADEQTCPYCGADRQGAVFTSVADATTIAPIRDRRDFVDLRDSGWLTRLARRKMVTAYPSLPERSETPSAPAPRPARKAVAVIASGVAIGVAAGGYLYVQSGGFLTSTKTVSAAGAIGDGKAAPDVRDDAQRPALARHDDAQSNASIAADREPQAPVAGSSVNRAAPPMASTTTSTVDAAVAATPASTPVSTTLAAKPTPKPTLKPTASTTDADVDANTPSNGDTAIGPVVSQTSPSAALSAASNAPKAPKAASDAASPPATTTLAATSEIANATASAASRATISEASRSSVTTQRSATATPAEASSPAIATQGTANAAPPTAAASPASSKDALKPSTAITSTQKSSRPQAAQNAPAVTRGIVAARQALASHDLAAARRHLRGPNSSQPRNPEVQQLAADVAREERARDTAMANARACGQNRDAACAVRNARRAVALDPRNAQTQALLRHAMSAQTDANAAYFRQTSALPPPVMPSMTFDGRWSVASKHAPAGERKDSSSRLTLFGWGVPTVSKGRGDAH